MTDTEATILVVDDDRSIRRALQRSLSTAGYAVETFGTVDDLIASPLCAGPGCLLLDVRLREMSGLDLPDRLRAAGHELPVIYMTGYGDVPTSVRAMKAGAVDFLPKPLETDDVLAAVERAMAIDRVARERRAEVQQLEGNLASLTTRERDVLELVVTGLLNKQIAARLGTSEKTVKVHRARVMTKMQASSLADLVRMAQRLDLDERVRAPLFISLDAAPASGPAALGAH